MTKRGRPREFTPEQAKQRRLEASRKYYAEHKKLHSERTNRWRANNLEKVRADEREWRRKNPEKARLADLKKRKSNPSRIRKSYKKWAGSNPEKVLANVNRRRCRQINSPGHAYTTDKHISSRWEMFGGRCWICGGKAVATDHVKPISKGGAHYPSNLRPACFFCNTSKKDRWPVLLYTSFMVLPLP